MFSDLQQRGVVLASLSAIGFGFLGIFGRVAQLNGMTNSQSLAWRFIVAGLILGVSLYRLELVRNIRLAPFLLGFFAYAAQSMLFFAAVEQIGPGKAALLLYTYPAVVTMLGWGLGRHRPAGADFIALGMTSIGCIMVLYSPTGEFSGLGTVVGLATALVYSLYLLLSERLLANIDPSQASFNVCLGAAISLSIFTLISGIEFVPTGGSQWAVSIGLALICTILPTIALFTAIRLIGAPKASICSTLEPAVAAILGAILLAERFNVMQVLGGIMIISSIIIVYRFQQSDYRNRNTG